MTHFLFGEHARPDPSWMSLCPIRWTMGQLGVDFSSCQCYWRSILVILSQNMKNSSGKIYSWLWPAAFLEQKALARKLKWWHGWLLRKPDIWGKHQGPWILTSTSTTEEMLRQKAGPLPQWAVLLCPTFCSCFLSVLHVHLKRLQSILQDFSTFSETWTNTKF